MLPKDKIEIQRDLHKSACSLLNENEEIQQKYLNDSVFHRLTNWMYAHIRTETFTQKDFIDAAKMATKIKKEVDYGCLLNLLEDTTITEEEHQKLAGIAWRAFDVEIEETHLKLRKTLKNLPEVEKK